MRGSIGLPDDTDVFRETEHWVNKMVAAPQLYYTTMGKWGQPPNLRVAPRRSRPIVVGGVSEFS